MVRLVRYPWNIPAVVILATCAVSAVVPALGLAQDKVLFSAEPGVLAADGTWILSLSVSSAQQASDLDAAAMTAWPPADRTRLRGSTSRPSPSASVCGERDDTHCPFLRHHLPAERCIQSRQDPEQGGPVY